jgi:hypothetical protein
LPAGDSWADQTSTGRTVLKGKYVSRAISESARFSGRHIDGIDDDVSAA